MASVGISRYLHKSGVRFVVRYRLGGRAAKSIHAGSFTSLGQAEQHRDWIRSKIASGTIVGFYRAPKVRREQQVYFGRLGDLIKIGISVDPETRCRALQADLLHVEAGGRRRERELHDKFAGLRERGEWFRADPYIEHYLRRAAREPEAVSARGERD